MKKFAQVMAVVMLVVMSLALLVSCGVSEKTAEKINNAAKNKDTIMSVDDVKKLCGGDPTADLSVLGTGFLVWVNGCKNLDEVNAKIEDGKTVKALYVSIAGGKATGAVYQDYDKNKK